MVKTINVAFDEKEFKKILKAKGDIPWHDFILLKIVNEQEMAAFIQMRTIAVLKAKAEWKRIKKEKLG